MTIIKLFPFSTPEFWPEVTKASNINSIKDEATLAIYQKYFSDQSNFQFANCISIDELLARMNIAANELPPEASKHHFKAQFFRGVLTSNSAIECLDSTYQFRKHFSIQFSPFILKETVEGYTELTNEEWFEYTFHNFLNTYPELSLNETIKAIYDFLKAKVDKYSNQSSLTSGELKMLTAYKRYLQFLTKNIINMPSYNKRQYAEILRVGKEEFDIEIKDIGKETHFVENYLNTALDKIELDQLENFLNHQAEGNKYCNIFLWLLDDTLQTNAKKLGAEKTELVYQWIETNTPFSRMYKKEADILFIEGRFFVNAKAERKWSDRIQEFIQGNNQNDILLFLEYGKEMIQQGYDLHLVTCTDKYNCLINTAYERKIAECGQLLNEIKLQLKEADSEQPKSINRMQWLGTQKQLAELFIELKRKGWIVDFEYEAIKGAFTKSNTIHQILKPGQDRDTKILEYDQVFTETYAPQFFNIIDNPKVITS